MIKNKPFHTYATKTELLEAAQYLRDIVQGDGVFTVATRYGTTASRVKIRACVIKSNCIGFLPDSIKTSLIRTNDVRENYLGNVSAWNAAINSFVERLDGLPECGPLQILKEQAKGDLAGLTHRSYYLVTNYLNICTKAELQKAFTTNQLHDVPNMGIRSISEIEKFLTNS